MNFFQLSIDCRNILLASEDGCLWRWDEVSDEDLQLWSDMDKRDEEALNGTSTSEMIPTST